MRRFRRKEVSSTVSRAVIDKIASKGIIETRDNKGAGEITGNARKDVVSFGRLNATVGVSTGLAESARFAKFDVDSVGVELEVGCEVL